MRRARPAFAPGSSPSACWSSPRSWGLPPTIPGARTISVLAANNRELANVGKALAEQLEVSLQSIDVLLQATADWYSGLSSTATTESINEALASPRGGAATGRAVEHHRRAGRPALSFTRVCRRGVQRGRSLVFLAHRDDPQQELFVSEPIVTRSDGRTAFVLSRRLRDTRAISPASSQRSSNSTSTSGSTMRINLGTKSAISLFRDDGTLVLRQPPMPESIGKKYPFAVELRMPLRLHRRRQDRRVPSTEYRVSSSLRA